MHTLRRDSHEIELLQPFISSLEFKLEIADLHESKANAAHREDHIAILKQQRTEILKAISLLKKGIRKRHLPIQVGTGLIMLGTLGYFISNLIEYLEYKNQTVPQQLMELKNEKSFLEHNMQQLIGSLNYLKKNITETFFSIHCEPRSIGGYCNDLLCPDDQLNCPTSTHLIKWYSDKCGLINIYNLTGCVPQSPTVDNCFRSIGDYCSTQSNLTLTSSSLENINYLLESLNYPEAIFYAATNGTLLYYLLTCGLGEFAPGIVLMLTLVSHVFTNCLSSTRLCFNLSKEDSDEILEIAENNDIEGNLTSYPKMLKKFQNKLPALDKALENYESRMAICMAKRDPESPLGLLFNNTISEPQLLRIIFEMAGKADSVFVRESSAPVRLAFETGAHIKNGTPAPDGKLKPLYSFFNRLREEKSNIENYENEQGAYPANQVLRNIYEFSGFLTPAKVSR